VAQERGLYHNRYGTEKGFFNPKTALFLSKCMIYHESMKTRTPNRSQKTNPEALRHQLLMAVLGQIPFDGWTDSAYQAGIKAAGLDAATAAKQFPDGLAGIVEFLGVAADAAMDERIAANRGFDRLRVREKISFAVRARLEFLTPHREAMRRLLMWYAVPSHAVQGVKRMAATVDKIWIAAGDIATDYNRYTKRILLAAVLKATILYWLDDETTGCTATWDFLDRRISDVLKLGKSLSLLREFSPSEIGDMIRRKMGMG